MSQRRRKYLAHLADLGLYWHDARKMGQTGGERSGERGEIFEVSWMSVDVPLTGSYRSSRMCNSLG